MKIYALLQKHEETALYLLFGGLTVAFNIGVFFLLDMVLEALAANSIAFVLSILFAYVTNSLFVFRRALTWNTFCPFLGMRLGTILIDNGGVFLLLSIGVGKLFTKCVVNVVIILCNYIFSKFFIFKEVRK